MVFPKFGPLHFMDERTIHLSNSPGRCSFSAASLLDAEAVEGVSAVDIEDLVASISDNTDVDTFED